MGNDGGVIAVKRRFFIKEKKREERKDKRESSAIQWSVCAMTHQPLKDPVRVLQH